MCGFIKSLAVCGVLVAGATSVQAELIGHWNFNEGSGTTATDVSGEGHNGAINGATYVSGPTGFGTALQFNDSEKDYVRVGGEGTALELVGSNYTIAFWIKWAGAGVNAAAQRIINMDDGMDYTGGYSVTLLKHATLGYPYQLAHNKSGNAGSAYFPGYAVPTVDVWTHVAIARDGLSRKIYINGVYQGDATLPIATLAGPTADGNDPLTFGTIFTSPTAEGIQFFNGALDDIRIYNEALTAEKVAGLMTVPEPATMALLGLGGMMMLRRR